jgi:hypothetical protein
LVERWFRDLTDKAIRRGVFASVDELIDAITAYVEAWNRQPTAYVWRKTAQQILDKVARGRAMVDSLHSDLPENNGLSRHEGRNLRAVDRDRAFFVWIPTFFIPPPNFFNRTPTIFSPTPISAAPTPAFSVRTPQASSRTRIFFSPTSASAESPCDSSD